MKIALSADFHLRSDDTGSERYDALKCILDRLLEIGISKLIIAGDLFDKDINHFAKFEEVVGDKKYSGISIVAIRGNHDLNLFDNSFTLSNFSVIEEPCWKFQNEWGIDFLFIPYIRNKKMADVIEKLIKQNKSNSWVLVSHGDLIRGVRQINSYEQGIYMPLFNIDIQRYKPSRVFIGHIHKSFDSGDVVIPGSPCGLDITETGKRSFVVFDTTTLECEREKIFTRAIFLNENLTMFPSKEEGAFIRAEIGKILQKWDISESDKKNVVMRMQINGYSSNIKNVKQEVVRLLEGMNLYNDGGIDFSELKQSSDVEREFFINKFEDLLSNEIREGNIDGSLRESIEAQAFDLVYGV
jgi:DNA repair exonuclease SbcCD nuclease subunit